MNELALFAGAGGGILGGKLLGWRTICAVEFDTYAASVLVARQNDGFLEPFPIWDDVKTFDGRPWRGRVDVVSGGFPCQDISAAGKGAGIEGAKSGLWVEMARIVGEVRPRFVFVENSPMLTLRGLDRVLGDLATLGYDANWGVLGASNVGAPHKRERIWIVAYADVERLEGTELQWLGVGVGVGSGYQGGDISNTDGSGEPSSAVDAEAQGEPSHRGYWATEPAVGRVADGVANRMVRLRAIGNGQVPAVAALAWETLKPEYVRNFDDRCAQMSLGALET